ncbi:MAG TPA: 50S ribosomal protein L25 [Candidatus Saccharimonadales bacterium]|nr:50S ribosomal protein L25 [Candidatus Saccharimonadales bacterium]
MSQDAITLTVDAREVTGKAVKHLRRDGLVPAVIHDHGKESVLVQGQYLELFRVYTRAGKHHPIELKAPAGSYTVLIKDATFEPRKNQLTHLVFNAVDKNQKVEAEVPIHPRYADEENQSSPAERASLIVLPQLETIQVKAIPSKIPDFVAYDAEKLVEVGDHVTVADLIVPADVEVLTEPEHAVAAVFEPAALAAANDAAGGDAEVADASETEAEHGSDTDQEAQEDEIRPGGKEQKESHDQGTNPEKE